MTSSRNRRPSTISNIIRPHPNLLHHQPRERNHSNHNLFLTGHHQTKTPRKLLSSPVARSLRKRLRIPKLKKRSKVKKKARRNLQLMVSNHLPRMSHRLRKLSKKKSHLKRKRGVSSIGRRVKNLQIKRKMLQLLKQSLRKNNLQKRKSQRKKNQRKKRRPKNDQK